MNAALFSSVDQRWNTPRWFIDRVEAAFGPVGLDPCSNADSVVRAAREYRFEERGEDGLSLPWEGLGLVYVNPPFGREIPSWARRWSAHPGELIALVPARTDTGWWQLAAEAAAEVLLWRGRLAYRLGGKDVGTAPFPSSVLYYGRRADVFRRTFGANGILLKGPIPPPESGRAPGSARELKRIRARLANAASSLEAIQSDDPSAEIAAAIRSVNDRLERYDGALQERAVPQRARKTRNGSRAEWAAVRASVRGISLDQVTLEGQTVAEAVVAPALAERGISRPAGSWCGHRGCEGRRTQSLRSRVLCPSHAGHCPEDAIVMARRPLRRPGTWSAVARAALLVGAARPLGIPSRRWKRAIRAIRREIARRADCSCSVSWSPVQVPVEPRHSRRSRVVTSGGPPGATP